MGVILVLPDGRSCLRHLRSYAVTELKKDVERELALLPESEREAKRTQFAVFVVHNKLKPKLAELPADMPYVSPPPSKRISSGRVLTIIGALRR